MKTYESFIFVAKFEKKNPEKNEMFSPCYILIIKLHA